MDNFIVNITLELKFTIVKCFIKLTTENNHLGGGEGEVPLKGWSPVLQVWIQLLHYIQITTYFLFWSNIALINWRPAVQ